MSYSHSTRDITFHLYFPNNLKTQAKDKRERRNNAISHDCTASIQFHYFLIKESGKYGTGIFGTLIIWVLTKILLSGVVCQVFVNDIQI